MCGQILVVDERGPAWVEPQTFEGSLKPAQNDIGSYIKHLEDAAMMGQKTPKIHDSYSELLDQIDLALIRLDLESRNDKRAAWTLWLNLIWTSKPEEQRLLLRSRGIPIRSG